MITSAAKAEDAPSFGTGQIQESEAAAQKPGSVNPRIQNEHAGCPIEAHRPKGRGSDVRQCFAPGKDYKHL